MKRTKKLFLILSGILFLSGCEMKQETTLTINQDKSVNIDANIALDYELIDTMIFLGESFDKENDNKTYTKEERIEKFKESAQIDSKEDIQIYDDGKYIGYKLSARVDNIDTLVDSQTNATTKNLAEIKNQKIFTKDGNTYKGNITIEKDEEENQYSEAMQQGLKTNITFTIKLPQKAISSNATNTSQDGKTLTWDLTKDIKNIEFEFSFKQDLDKKLIWASITSLIIAIIIFTIIMLVINKKKNNKKEISAETPIQVQESNNIVPINTEPSIENPNLSNNQEQNINNNQM